jgi:hypothetical protein
MRKSVRRVGSGLTDFERGRAPVAAGAEFGAAPELESLVLGVDGTSAVFLAGLRGVEGSRDSSWSLVVACEGIAN